MSFLLPYSSSPLLLFSSSPLLQLDSKIKLIDSPGVIFEENTNDAGLLLRNCISVDKLDDPIPAAEAIFARCRPAQLMTVYAMQRFDGYVLDPSYYTRYTPFIHLYSRTYTPMYTRYTSYILHTHT